MYGAKGTTIINTVTRQSALTKQLTTLHAANKTSAFISSFPARSGKLYTTTRTLNNNDNNNNNNNKDLFHGNSFAPLARASNWNTKYSLKNNIVRQHVKFNTSVAHKSQLFESTMTPELLIEEPNARILELARVKNHSAVVQEFMASKKADASLNNQTYQAVIESYGNLQRKNQPLTDMMNVYNEMITNGIRPTSETYAILIKNLCARDSEVNRASNVLRRQIDINAHNKESVSLTSTTVNTLNKTGSDLQALESERNLQKAIAVFEHAVQEKSTQAFDVDLYNNLLRGLSYVGNTQDGLFIYEQLENSRIRPNETTFAMLMSMFGNAGDLKSVGECFKEYKSVSRGLPTHDRSYIYNALVFAHVNAGDLDGALKIIEQTMVNDRVTVTISPYNRILYRACLDGNMDLVTELMNKLKSNDKLPKPDANTYGLLLSNYSKMMNLDRAKEAYNELLKLNLNRQYGHLSEFVTACIADNQRDFAMDVVRQMSTHGLELDSTLCCKVVNSFVQTGDYIKSADVVKEVIQLHAKSNFIKFDSPLIKAAFNIAHESNDLIVSLDILRILNNYSIRTTPTLSSTILDLYRKAKNDPATWNEFKDYCNERTYYTLYETAFKTQLSGEQFSKLAFELLNDMHQFNIGSNSSIYIRVSTRMSKTGCLEDEAKWKQLFVSYYPTVQEQLNQLTSPLSSSASITSTSENASVSSVSTSSSYDLATRDLLSGEALSLALRGNYDNALTVLKEKIIDRGLVPSPEAIRDMIQTANKLGKLEVTTAIYDLVNEPFHQLESTQRNHALNILNNNMLIAHARKNDLTMAKVFYDKLRANGVYPDADAYGCLLTCAVTDTTDESLDAMVIYEEAKKHDVKPTVYFYNVIISQLSKCRKLEPALLLFNEMQELGIQPNTVTYSSVISACIRCSSEARAVHYFNEMIKLPRYQPRIGVYNSMIQYYVQQKNDREKALEYYHKLKKANITPSAHTYKLLIEAYANITPYDMITSHGLLSEMKKKSNIDPTATHYATLIKSYGCLHRDVKSAQAVYNEMNKANVKPNELVYQALLDTYIENSKMSDAEQLYQDMLSSNMPSSPYIENLFIRGYGEQHQLEKAEEVFNQRLTNEKKSEMDIVREPSTYEAMVKVYVEHNQLDKANEVLNLMKLRDFPVKVVEGVSILLEQ
ncbi:unnamed protein product [Cunninghamella blakesleeana]